MYINGEFYDATFGFGYIGGIELITIHTIKDKAEAARKLRELEKRANKLAERSINPYNDEITYLELEYSRSF